MQTPLKLSSRKINCCRGFTLIELLVVMTVLSVLTLIVVPQFVSRAKQSREASLRRDLQALRNAMHQHWADCWYTTPDLNHLCGVHTANGVVHGPYLLQVPQDPTQPANAGLNGNWNFDFATQQVHSATAAYASW